MPVGTEETKKQIEKMGMNVLHIAQDPFYLSDLSDDALKDIYSLVHNDYQKRATVSNRPNDSEVDALKAEVALLREFSLRKIISPKMDDILTRQLNDLTGRLRKYEDKTYLATTQPDIYDQHVHDIKGLTKDGDGQTDEAGNPGHTHNVNGFMVAPIENNGYKSDHPGKVDVKVGKSAFRVTKKYDDGRMDWEAEFDIIQKNDDKRLVAGVVYEPDIEDAQGDSAGPDEIEKAAHNYMIRSQTIGLMHERRVMKGESALVENFIAPTTYMVGSQVVHKGSWVQVHKIFSDDLWNGIKKGDYTGFSMGGKARDANRHYKMEKSEEAFSTSFRRFSFFLKHDVEKVIRPVGNEFCVFTQDGKRRLGCKPTREGALQLLAAIEANKGKPVSHLNRTKVEKAEDYMITAEHMGQICTKCARLMKKRGISKVKLGTIMNEAKFKRVFGIRRSSIGHNGLCRKFSTNAKLFKDEILKVKT